MIDEEIVLKEFRRRMVAATGIDPETQLKTENTDFEISAPTVCEYAFNGTEELSSNGRSRIPDFMLEYDVLCPRNSGGEKARAIARAIREEFDPASYEKSRISGLGFDGVVTRASPEPYHDERIMRLAVVLHADIWQAS